jgi:signal transduction histidine kinase
MRVCPDCSTEWAETDSPAICVCGMSLDSEILSLNEDLERVTDVAAALLTAARSEHGTNRIRLIGESLLEFSKIDQIRKKIDARVMSLINYPPLSTYK